MISNYTGGLRYQDYKGIFPRLKSKYTPNVLLINSNGILDKYIYLNGHIVGYQDAQFQNIVLDWPKVQKYRKKEELH